MLQTAFPGGLAETTTTTYAGEAPNQSPFGGGTPGPLFTQEGLMNTMKPAQYQQYFGAGVGLGQPTGLEVPPAGLPQRPQEWQS